MTTKSRKPTPWRRTLRRFIYGVPISFRIIVVLLVVVVIYFFNRPATPDKVNGTNIEAIQKSNKSEGGLPKGNPTYTTYLPEGKTIDDYGGWTRVSPAKNDPVYAFVDKIGTVTIRVSQQRIPNAFKGDVENKVAELAEEFLATQKITVKDVTVYVGRSASGVESIIFVKGDTLINITTDNKVSDDALVKYIESLN